VQHPGTRRSLGSALGLCALLALSPAAARADEPTAKPVLPVRWPATWSIRPSRPRGSTLRPTLRAPASAPMTPYESYSDPETVALRLQMQRAQTQRPIAAP